MSTTEKNTLELIFNAAQREFMKKGFESASLRRIVREAGVTTGAFYGYFKSKEALFEALVGEQYNYILNCFIRAQNKFAALPKEEQPQKMGEISGECMNDMLIYAYDHSDSFRLILCHSQGTKFSDFIDKLAEIEAEGTHKYYRVLEALGRPSPKIDEHLEHIIITGMFNTFFEMIIHEMPLEKAKVYLKEMRDFYTAGWQKIMGQGTDN